MALQDKSVGMSSEFEKRLAEALKRYNNFFEQKGQYEISDKTDIKGDKYLLIRATSLSTDFFETIRHFYKQEPQHAYQHITREFLYNTGFVIGHNDAQRFNEDVQPQGFFEKISAGTAYMHFTGWARINISEKSKPYLDKTFLLLYEQLYSFELDAWLSKEMQSNFPVCIMCAGYFAGWCSNIFDMPLMACELTCKAKGDDACRFIMAPPDEMEMQSQKWFKMNGQGMGSNGDEELKIFIPKETSAFLYACERNIELANDELMVLTKDLSHQNFLLGKLNKMLYEAEQRFKQSFEFAAIGMALVSPSGQWLKVNKALCSLVGYSEDELLKMTFQKITYPEDLAKDIDYVNQLSADEIESYQMEKRYICKSGEVIWALLSVTLVRDQVTNKPLYFIAQIQNINTQKKYEAQLKKMASQDFLTGLLNRNSLSLLFDLMKKQLKQDALLGIYFIDLDNFKKKNDKHGHLMGDRMLEILAKRMKNSSRSTDGLGRIGGADSALYEVKASGRDGYKIFNQESKEPN